MDNQFKKRKMEILSDFKNQYDEKIIEKSNYDFLLKIINNLKTFDDLQNLHSLGTLYYKTGLIYQPILEKQTDNIRYFFKNKKLSLTNEISKNKLILGDNYHALKNLLIQYTNKIDIIYIDPPYGCNDMGEFARVNYNNQISRDNLLSMLEYRLKLAKELLSDEGIILCSLDDKNHSYIKLLFDRIFGESNFIANFCRNTSNSHSSTKIRIDPSIDYVLFYCKDKTKKELFIQTKKKKYNFNKSDKNGNYLLKNFLSGDHTELTRPNKSYPIYVSKNLKNISFFLKSNYIEIMPTKKNSDLNGCWAWGKNWKNTEYNSDFDFKKNPDLAKTNINLLVAKRNNKQEIEIFRKHYSWDNSGRKKKFSSSPYSNIIENNLNSAGTKDLKKILSSKVFDFPKPASLIKYLIKITNPNPNIVLDFFAGSGTTGQAVMELNHDDVKKGKPGNRKFILVTLDEDLEKQLKKCKKEQKETTKNAIEFCKENNLPKRAGSIAYERLKRIATGKSSSGKNFEWDKKYNTTFDVYEIKKIKEYDFNVFKIIDERLYNQKKLNINEKINWVCNSFSNLDKTLFKK